MFRWHPVVLTVLPPDIGVCVLPISSYFSLEIRLYNTAKAFGCLDAIAGTALPLFPSFPSSPYTSIYRVPFCAPLARKYRNTFFFQIQISFLLLLPSLNLARGWVRGARKDGEWKWQPSSISPGLQLWGCMRNPEPSLCTANPGGKWAAMPFQHLGCIFLSHLQWLLRDCL